jgi:hypothetical protein
MSKEELDLMGGFACNQDTMVFWEESDAVIHVCRMVSRKEQQEQYRESKEQDRSRERKKRKKQEEIKEVYSQLM